MSNRLAGDAATDEAFESAQDLEEPVQSNIDSSRAIAGETGAVGGTAFTVEGYERTTVVDAILDVGADRGGEGDLMARACRGRAAAAAA
jgi:hypothetical protein